MKYIVYFEIYGKKMKTVVEASSEEHAKYKIMGKIRFHKIERMNEDSLLDFLTKLWTE